MESTIAEIKTNLVALRTDTNHTEQYNIIIEECMNNPALFVQLLKGIKAGEDAAVLRREVAYAFQVLFWNDCYDEDETEQFLKVQVEGREIYRYLLDFIEQNYSQSWDCLLFVCSSLKILQGLTDMQKLSQNVLSLSSVEGKEEMIEYSLIKFKCVLLLSHHKEEEVLNLFTQLSSDIEKGFLDFVSDPDGLAGNVNRVKRSVGVLTSFISCLMTVIYKRNYLFFYQSIDLMCTLYNEVQSLLGSLSSNTSAFVAFKLKSLKRSMKNALFHIVKNYYSMVKVEYLKLIIVDTLEKGKEDLKQLRQILSVNGINLYEDAAAKSAASGKASGGDDISVEDKCNLLISGVFLNYSKTSSSQPILEIPMELPLELKIELLIDGIISHEKYSEMCSELKQKYIVLLQQYVQSIVEEEDEPMMQGVSAAAATSGTQAVSSSAPFILKSKALSDSRKSLLETLKECLKKSVFSKTNDELIEGDFSYGKEFDAPDEGLQKAAGNSAMLEQVDESRDDDYVLRLMETDGTPYLVEQLKLSRQGRIQNDPFKLSVTLEEFKGSPVYWSVFLSRMIYQLAYMENFDTEEGSVLNYIIEFISAEFRNRWVLGLRLVWEEYYQFKASNKNKMAQFGSCVLKCLLQKIIDKSIEDTAVLDESKVFVPYLAKNKNLFVQFLLFCPSLPSQFLSFPLAKSNAKTVDKMTSLSVDTYLYEYIRESGETPLSQLKIRFGIECVSALICHRADTRHSAFYIFLVMLFMPLAEFASSVRKDVILQLGERIEWANRLPMVSGLFLNAIGSMYNNQESALNSRRSSGQMSIAGEQIDADGDEDMVDYTDDTGVASSKHKTLTEVSLDKAMRILRPDLEPDSMFRCLDIYVTLMVCCTSPTVSVSLITGLIQFLRQVKSDRRQRLYGLLMRVKDNVKSTTNCLMASQPQTDVDFSYRVLDSLLGSSADTLEIECVLLFFTLLDSWLTTASPFVVVTRPSSISTKFLKKIVQSFRKSKDDNSVEFLIVSYYLLASEQISPDTVLSILIHMAVNCLGPNVPSSIRLDDSEDNENMSVDTISQQTSILFALFTNSGKEKEDNLRILFCYSIINAINFHGLNAPDLLVFFLTDTSKKIPLQVSTILIKLFLNHPLLQSYFTLRSFQTAFTRILDTTPPVIFMFAVQGLLLKYKKDQVILQTLVRDFLLKPIQTNYFRIGMRNELKRVGSSATKDVTEPSQEDVKCKALFIGWLDCLTVAAPYSFEVLLKFGNVAQLVQLLSMLKKRKKSEGILDDLEAWLNEQFSAGELSRQHLSNLELAVQKCKENS